MTNFTEKTSTFHRGWQALTALLFLASANTLHASILLYDPTLGDVPGSQSWLTITDGSTQETYSNGLTSLDTTVNRADQSGYFSEDPWLGAIFAHGGMPTLDRSTGFTIQFELQVVDEGHNLRDDNGDGLFDRAGFSVIAISDDLLGLEIGFFQDRVWVYATDAEGPNSLFTQAEGNDFNTTAGLVEYQLAVFHNTYTLLADGQPLFGGALRNYNPTGLNPLADPYNNPSFLFFGDDTTSADAHVRIGKISVELFAVPEPNGLWLAGVGFLALLSHRGAHNRAALPTACQSRSSASRQSLQT